MDGRMKALAELAALAAKVPGFVRPLKYCDECDDPMEFPGKIRDEYGQTRTCGWCDGAGTLFDNSPAALLMAVALAVPQLHLGQAAVTCRRPQIPGSNATRGGGHTMTGARTAEELARAALLALLRAHGVDVAEDGRPTPTAVPPARAEETHEHHQ